MYEWVSTIIAHTSFENHTIKHAQRSFHWGLVSNKHAATDDSHAGNHNAQFGHLPCSINCPVGRKDGNKKRTKRFKAKIIQHLSTVMNKNKVRATPFCHQHCTLYCRQPGQKPSATNKTRLTKTWQRTKPFQTVYKRQIRLKEDLVTKNCHTFENNCQVKTGVRSALSFMFCLYLLRTSIQTLCLFYVQCFNTESAWVKLRWNEAGRILQLLHMTVVHWY